MSHYIIIRDDLSIGDLAAQVTHAAGESSPGNLPEHTIAVVLGVNPQELEDVSAILTKHDIAHRRIVEVDPPFCGQLMALGVIPRPKRDVYPLLKKYSPLGAQREGKK